MPTRVSSRIRAWRVAVRVALVCVVVSALGATYERIQDRRDLAALPPPGLMVDVDGHRLHLWCFGQGAPTVIFDSGLGGTAFDWYPVLRDVSGFTTACAYDRAGMGYSEPGPSPRTSRRIAGELAEPGRSPILDVTMPLQRDLLRLSARSCQIVAAKSDHMIPMRAPDSIVRATRVVIDTWRTLSMPTC